MKADRFSLFVSVFSPVLQLPADRRHRSAAEEAHPALRYKGKLIASAQAGPMLLPDLRLEEEFFVVKNAEGRVIRESASVLHKCARTLIGIKEKEVVYE